MINMTDRYTTRDGRPARVLAIDAKSIMGCEVPGPVIALIVDPGGSESAVRRFADGRLYHDIESRADLIPYVEPDRTSYTNVYPRDFGMEYPNLTEAKQGAFSDLSFICHLKITRSADGMTLKSVEIV